LVDESSLPSPLPSSVTLGRGVTMVSGVTGAVVVVTGGSRTVVVVCATAVDVVTGAVVVTGEVVLDVVGVVVVGARVVGARVVVTLAPAALPICTAAGTSAVAPRIPKREIRANATPDARSDSAQTPARGLAARRGRCWCIASLDFAVRERRITQVSLIDVFSVDISPTTSPRGAPA